MVAAAVGSWRFAQRESRGYPRQPPPLALPEGQEALAHGAHFARTIAGCAQCHGEDFGGQVMDGRSLLVMPSAHLRAISTTDMAAVIAFMRTLPPVDRQLGDSRVKPLGGIVLGLAGAPVLSAEEVLALPQRAAAPAPGATRAYGEYLAGVCRGCHGDDLRGGLTVHPGAPPSPDISAQALARWDFATFERALRQGVARDGHVMGDGMPWRAFRGITAEEMRALWLGLRSN